MHKEVEFGTQNNALSLHSATNGTHMHLMAGWQCVVYIVVKGMCG